MSGLTSKQARERLRQDGENELSASAKLHPVRMFLGQFRDVMVLILLAATAVSAFLGEVTDAVTIILIVLLNAILGFLQEFRTEQTLESLRNLTAPTAAVCRDGTWQTIPARELVRGDCIRLEAGDNVPADAALALRLSFSCTASPSNRWFLISPRLFLCCSGNDFPAFFHPGSTPSASFAASNGVL